MKNYQLEICCYSLDSARIAQQAGAHRIELCAGMPEGGTTPSYATIKKTCQQLSIPVHVIIRPRGGDFLYTAAEFELMKEDVLMAKELGAKGVVFGILTSGGAFDLVRNNQLIQLAKPMSVTFHRAFDMVKYQEEVLHQLIELGVDRVLTSGKKQTAPEGKEQLKRLHSMANGKIEILAGSGVNSSNLKELAEFTNIREFHMSAKKRVASQMKYFNPEISMGGNESVSEYDTYISDASEIEKSLKILNELQ